MACLDEIVAFLDEELRLGEVPDYPGAVNGLQMQGGREVQRVAAAVDASLPVVKKAVEAGMDLLVVHHGMFWNGVRPVTGVTYEKFKTAMEAGLAIYSAHIPLDVHPVLGNNARLSAALELQDTEPFFEWRGTLLGIRGIFPGSLDQLTARVTEVLGSPP
ncbi:MAG: Nif3-like dinuclear metal center hexameric protein, partial [Roseibacillus sp.]|nr:Nif3-like dinuclear metal center hexameric protein [Roseibacillus sp.]